MDPFAKQVLSDHQSFSAYQKLYLEQVKIFGKALSGLIDNGEVTYGFAKQEILRLYSKIINVFGKEQSDKLMSDFVINDIIEACQRKCILLLTDGKIRKANKWQKLNQRLFLMKGSSPLINTLLKKCKKPKKVYNIILSNDSVKDKADKIYEHIVLKNKKGGEGEKELKVWFDECLRLYGQ